MGIFLHRDMSFWVLNSDRAIAPKKGTAKSAGWDLYAEEDFILRHDDGNVVVKLSVAIAPGAMDGAYMRIAPRSGNAVKHVTVDAGVVDEDFVNSIGVVMRCVKPGHAVEFKRGDRIAQCIFTALHDPEAAYAAALARGASAPAEKHEGFGSTGQ